MAEVVGPSQLLNMLLSSPFEPTTIVSKLLVDLLC
jgi:hypothetical protein